MGWKAVRDHYKIEHSVHVVDGNLCIGSAYISQILVIAPDGSFIKSDTSWIKDQLSRYQSEIESDPDLFAKLFAAEDSFERSIDIYTYNSGTFEIESLQCETPEWPHTTHDGQLIYDNSFSTDRNKIVEYAKSELTAWIKLLNGREKELEETLAETRRDRTSVMAALKRLYTEPSHNG